MRALVLILLVSCVGQLAAQSGFVYIDSISVSGNKKTKDDIIIRELPFALGDSIPIVELSSKLKQAEQFLMNTSLFNQVKPQLKNWEGETNKIHIHFEIQETWYVYPFPIFELADRNFNVWWVEQNRSLQRVNFGLEFSHFNFSGRRDKLKFFAKYGYTQNYAIQYNLPYLNKEKTIGISGAFSYFLNREINYATVNNRQEFYRDDNEFISRRVQSELGLYYRPKIRKYHQFFLRFHYNQVSEKITKELNPYFFPNGANQQRYLSFVYNYIFDDRDIRFYPLNGIYYSLTLEKHGIGAFQERNALVISAEFRQYFSFSKRWSLGTTTKGKASLIRVRQPYNDNRALGFSGDFLRGYEYYIIDGLDMAYFKTNLRYNVFDRSINFGKLMPIKAFRYLPLKLYLTLNNDVGYVNDPFHDASNFLNNKLLWGGGFGLDLVFYYDKVFRIEYSFNQLMEKGLFLHLNLNI